MLIIVFFLRIMEYGSTCICAFEKNGKLNKFLRFSALFGTIFRVMVKKIRKVRWNIVSIVLFLNILWGNCIFRRFVEL